MTRRSQLSIALIAAAGIAIAILFVVRGGGRRTSAAAGPPAAGGAPVDRAAARELPAMDQLPAPPAQYDDDPAGTERLEGLVLDAADQPVAGVTVVIDAHPAREAQSAEDGSFVFDALSPRTYQIEARRAQQLAGPVAVRLSARSEPVVLRLRDAARLDITVRTAADDRPVAGAVVELRDLAMVSAVTGDDGLVSLLGVGGGWHILHVSAPGHAAAAQEVAITDAPGVAVAVTVRLRAGVSAGGVVLDAAGRPVEGARVTAELVSRFDAADPRLDGVLTDAKGRWRLVGLPRETARFHAAHPRFAPASTGLVPLTDGVERTGVVITVAAGATVSGRVVDGTGQPVAGAEVRVLAGPRHAGNLRRAACDASGRFVLTGLPRQRVHLAATVEAAASPVAVVDLRPVDRADVELTLSLAATISGVVVTPDGQPVGEARVVAQSEMGSDLLERVERALRGDATAIADADGNFRLTGLEPGTYRIRAIRPGAASALLGMRPGTAVTAGTTGARIEIDALATVRGRVAYADGTAPGEITIRLGLAPPREFRGDRFVLEEVPAGKHYLEVDGPALVTQTKRDVEVAAGADVDLGTIEVQRGRRVHGLVTDPGGKPVAGAAVVIGTEIEGDGTTLTPYPTNVRQVVSGADGRYLADALSASPYVIAADHDDVGRATTSVIPAGNTDVERNLVLQRPAVLEGMVRVDGEPADAAVILRPATGADAKFVVPGGADGTYRFDRLAPGKYIAFAAISRGTRAEGGDSGGRNIELAPGQSARVDFDLTAKGVTVVFALTSPGDVVQYGYGVLAVVDEAAPASSFPHTISEARSLLANMKEIEIREAMIVKDRRVELAAVRPGLQVACATALRGDPADPNVVAEMQRSASVWPISCKYVTITDSPARQEVTVEVQPVR